jgi:hypothetical protein
MGKAANLNDDGFVFEENRNPCIFLIIITEIISL